MVEALDIRVRGIVQGVGFRPFVYRIARHNLIKGWVLNDKEGVFIHAEGESDLLDAFILELSNNPPAASQVSEIEMKEVPLLECTSFEIKESECEDTDDITRISPDLGICPDCLAELFDVNNRRYRYPFINCTNCGPRYTIVEKLPYDRADTSMRTFTMCDECESEYLNPANRRFHAQPDCCFVCGPHLYDVSALAYPTGEDAVVNDASTEEIQEQRRKSDELLSAAVQILARGGIVALKGLGGYHLVCDASSEAALKRLRECKQRDGKPFAVMTQDERAAGKYCDISSEEAALLTSPARPIVLLKKKGDVAFAEGLADGLCELGVMLPSTPLQALLVADYYAATKKDLLVMTSGNISGEPIVIDDVEAVRKLASVADLIIGHDRPILSRFDDSVLRVLNLGDTTALQLIRRARGYAPEAVPLKAVDANEEIDTASIFAAGSQQKNTITLTRGEDAFVSQYLGDLEDADTFDAWLETKKRMQTLFEITPEKIVCDLHPEYLASKEARAIAEKESLPLVEVQHHHSHIASVLAEQEQFGPCCGIAFDGTGYGADGALWGGEVLIANQADYERFINLTYLPMPGGQICIHEPLRMAYGMLYTYDLLDHPGTSYVHEALGEQADVCASLIENGMNTPYTSSMGRFFDGVAALLGICPQATYEGQPAIMLDALQEHLPAPRTFEELCSESYELVVEKNAATAQSTAHDTSVLIFDGEKFLKQLLDDYAQGVPIETIARRFHNGIVQGIVVAAELVRGVYDIDFVVLSGGCFMNRYLVEQSTLWLKSQGFTVALNADLPPNDGCVSYGQAVVARFSR